MAYYSIDDAHGNQLTTGLSEILARQVGARLADERNEIVYVYKHGTTGAPIPIEPSTYPNLIHSTAVPRIDYARIPADRAVREIHRDAQTGTWIASTIHADGSFGEHITADSRESLIRRLRSLA